METAWSGPRGELVEVTRSIIARGSTSFAMASRLLAPQVRERVWLLYAWCRAADDLTDGQEVGHSAATPGAEDARQRHARLTAWTHEALDTEVSVPLPFAALRQVAREVPLDRAAIAAHLSGFALDAAGWGPQTTDDLLDYCYRVAGAVGVLMAPILGAPAGDADTLDRAADLGIAFQLANIARDIVPDAAQGRCYIPAEWLSAAGVSARALAGPETRAISAMFAQGLAQMALSYRRSARVGAVRLPFRSRWAVLAAEGIYGAIGEAVAARGAAAWDERVIVPNTAKLAVVGRSLLGAAGRAPEATARDGLWQRPPGSAAALR